MQVDSGINKVASWKEPFQALVDRLIDCFSYAIESLKDFRELIASTPEEALVRPELLSKGDRAYARILRSESCIEVFPVQSLGVKADDKAVKWLESMFKKAMDRYKDFKVDFVEKNGLLYKIRVEGNLAEFERLRNAVLWAFEKAANHPISEDYAE